MAASFLAKSCLEAMQKEAKCNYLFQDFSLILFESFGPIPPDSIYKYQPLFVNQKHHI